MEVPRDMNTTAEKFVENIFNISKAAKVATILAEAIKEEKSQFHRGHIPLEMKQEIIDQKKEEWIEDAIETVEYDMEDATEEEIREEAEYRITSDIEQGKYDIEISNEIESQQLFENKIEEWGRVKENMYRMKEKFLSKYTPVCTHSISGKLYLYYEIDGFGFHSPTEKVQGEIIEIEDWESLKIQNANIETLAEMLKISVGRINEAIEMKKARDIKFEVKLEKQ